MWNKMKNKWSRYALKNGKVKSSYIKKHSNRDQIRKATKASCCNCNVKSRQKQIETAKKEILAHFDKVLLGDLPKIRLKDCDLVGTKLKLKILKPKDSKITKSPVKAIDKPKAKAVVKTVAKPKVKVKAKSKA